MKAVILAGGLGTRLAEETEIRPKPMVQIGGQPILWHIMKHYAHYGVREFVLALGYLGDTIKRYFLEQSLFHGDMTIELSTGRVNRSEIVSHEPWVVHLKDTGADTMTGGRVLRLREFLGNEPFLLTYGDGVADIDIEALLAFHKSQGLQATISAVRPPARFGGLLFDGNRVAQFTEKSQAGEGWINGGFMVCEPSIFELLENDRSVFELSVLERLAERGQLAAYRHEGFWQCMDTLRDKRLLNELWQSNKAPWKVWK